MFSIARVGGREQTKTCVLMGAGINLDSERRCGQVNGYLIRVEIQDGEIEQILRELNEAQEKIYQCYSRLQEAGMVVVRKETASGN